MPKEVRECIQRHYAPHLDEVNYVTTTRFKSRVPKPNDHRPLLVCTVCKIHMSYGSYNRHLLSRQHEAKLKMM